MRKIVLPMTLLAFAAACADRNPTGLGPVAGPSVGGPSFHEASGKNGVGKLEDPAISTTATTTSTSTFDLAWSESKVPTIGRNHYSLANYAVTVKKTAGTGAGAPVSTTFPTVASTTLTGLCNGTYEAAVKGHAAAVASKNDPNTDGLSSHNSHEDTHTFTVTNTACAADVVVTPPGGGDVVITVPAVGNQKPVLTAIDPLVVAEGHNVAFTATATNEAGQTLTYTITDKPAGATFTSGGAFNWTPTDGPQTVTFKITVTDNGTPAMSDEQTVSITVNNVAPKVSLTPTSATALQEGGLFTATGSFTDPGDDTWKATVNYGDGTVEPVTLNADKTFSLSHTYLDDATPGTPADNYTVTVTVTETQGDAAQTPLTELDGDGTAVAVGGTSAPTTVTVTNVAPTISAFGGNLLPIAINTGVATMAGAYSDPAGALDNHVVSINWGDGTSTPGTGAYGVIGGTHSYAVSGIFTVTVTVTDKDTGAASAPFSYIVVYDPDGGFVTGGGHFNTAKGSCLLATLCSSEAFGKTTFGFVSKYVAGRSEPTGNTEFQFHAGNVRFKSTSYQALIIQGTKAVYWGYGTVNGGTTQYSFRLTAYDEAAGDKIQIELWEAGNWEAGQIVNGRAAFNTGETPIQAGSIQLKK